MKCPYCGHEDSKVIDSRPTDEGNSIRRRRECIACQNRFTTYEVIENTPIVVRKKDGSREAFNRQKLLNGIMRACAQRPVSLEEMEKIVIGIEQKLQNDMCREISSAELGDLALSELKTVDEVAYIRFASVYRRFNDINSFMQELNKLMNEK
jgi:transcriptional repressor NrdR